MPSPKPAETSVVKFTGKPASRASRDAEKRPKHPDAKLIEACIEYAMLISSVAAAFDVDPTNSLFAGSAASLASQKSAHALLSASTHQAKTLDGIRAKAELVDMALNDIDGDLDPLHQEFLRSLANDIIKFHFATVVNK